MIGVRGWHAAVIATAVVLSALAVFAADSPLRTAVALGAAAAFVLVWFLIGRDADRTSTRALVFAIALVLIAGVGTLADGRQHRGDRAGDGDVAGLELLVEGGDGVTDIHFGRAELQERVDEWPQLSCFHQGLACKPDETRQAIGRHSDHAIGLLGRPRGRRWRLGWFHARRRGGGRSGGGCSARHVGRRLGRPCGWRRCLHRGSIGDHRPEFVDEPLSPNRPLAHRREGVV
jgi:hypothetical protein